MALKRIKGNLDRVLDKNLQDIVRGIRNHKDDEAKFIAECLDEIKQELRTEDLATKANAISKLIYLEMLGYEISWAAFNIIEVMSSTKFTQKRVGYLAASQSFHVGTDVLMLATNMIRKDLCSANMYDAGVALSGLSCFITADLAQDLASDIMSLLTSTRPYLKKKAVLLMYKVFLNYPDALRPSFPRLKDRLDDPDPGVQSAAVNVICELARKNPKNYLTLAPTFFKLMTSSSNNWMLIKIIKLFGALTPLEPRLGKKLIEPLTNLIHSTSAMSLLYECINTVIAVLVSISSDLPNHATSVQLCVQKLRVLIEDSDQNLKYLGLLAMSKILKTHPKSVQAHKDLILQCLDDRDESIRLRALDLLYGMVSKKNLMEIVKKLMIHMDKAEGTVYRDQLMSKIIDICSQNNYQHVVNFEWYVSILVELTKIRGTQHGRLLADQMMDVAIRVSAIRAFTVHQMAILLDNGHLFVHNSQRNGICEILYAAAWICGEFSAHLRDPLLTLQAMFKSKVTSLPGCIQAVYVQNIIKLYASVISKAEKEGDKTRMLEVGQLLLDKLTMFVQSGDLEVQERACSALQLVKYVGKLLDKGVTVGEEVSCLFCGDLNPVAPKAQKKVPVPEGLDLDQWINAQSKPKDITKTKSIFAKEDTQTFYGDDKNNKKEVQLSEAELQKQREARRLAQDSNPHYLKLGAKNKPSASQEVINVDDIPIEALDLNVDLEMTRGLDGLAKSDKYYNQTVVSRSKKKRGKEKKGKKGRRRKEESDEELQPVHQVSAVVEMPEGATVDEKSDDDSKDTVAKALDINLDEPLRDDERLPVPKHRTAALPEPVDKSAMKRSEQRKKKKKSAEKDSKKKPSKTKDRKVNGEALINMPVPELLQVAVEGAAPKPPSVISPQVSAPADTIMKQSKKKKSSGDKERKKSSKTSKHQKKKNEYEQADGLTTPNKETTSGRGTPSLSVDPAVLGLTNYRTLAADQFLKLDFEPRFTMQQTNTFIVSVIFSNLCPYASLKSMDFNVLDTMNAKLMREEKSEAVKVPFELLPSLMNEAQFVFTVKSICQPQKLKGTVTYIVKNDSGADQQKLDFRLVINCRDCLISTPCDSETFTKLLTDSEMNAKASKRFTSANDFRTLLLRISFFAHAYVVEQVDTSASLYTRSIQGHHVCLLVKQLISGEYSLDGKSTDSDLLSNIIGEMHELLKD